ncbi:DUF2164 domain-containing protein [Clostridium sediminicola]|uniref:DUF2164 domain-containing protein n=1 Tax=Clostridium sediminicola TaxID=3114879 RepID=UPI0031F23CD0
MNKKIELNKENRDLIIEEIKKFFYEERDEEIGELASMLFLDFIMENIAPEIYNKGVKDSIAFMTDKIDDMYGLEIRKR